MNQMPEKRYEEYAYILDFLPHGRPGGKQSYKAGSLVQVIGEAYFTLLEAIVKEGISIKLSQRVYVGKDSRDKITYIIGRIGYNELTTTARTELLTVVEKIVTNRENWFINFFNNSQAITPRMHSLEFIPGIGKKYMWQIINTREKKRFSSFEDIKDRTELPDPVKLLTKRILEELSQDSKYRLFTRIN